MDTQKKLAYLDYLQKFVTKERQKKIKEVLKLRTKHITIVLEDVCNSQNVAAIMRTAEAMGLQQMYAIELGSELDVKSNVARGAIQWMELHRYQKKDFDSPVASCIKALRDQEYVIIATSPHATKKIEDLSIDKKYAFLFGTENTGLSEQAFACADESITLPQYGFVESYNVAVAAALCLYQSVGRLRSSNAAWQLQPDDLLDVEISWLERSLDRPEIIKNNFLKDL